MLLNKRHLSVPRALSIQDNDIEEYQMDSRHSLGGIQRMLKGRGRKTSSQQETSILSDPIPVSLQYSKTTYAIENWIASESVGHFTRGRAV